MANRPISPFTRNLIDAFAAKKLPVRASRWNVFQSRDTRLQVDRRTTAQFLATPGSSDQIVARFRESPDSALLPAMETLHLRLTAAEFIAAEDVPASVLASWELCVAQAGVDPEIGDFDDYFVTLREEVWPAVTMEDLQDNDLVLTQRDRPGMMLPWGTHAAGLILASLGVFTMQMDFSTLHTVIGFLITAVWPAMVLVEKHDVTAKGEYRKKNYRKSLAHEQAAVARAINDRSVAVSEERVIGLAETALQLGHAAQVIEDLGAALPGLTANQQNISRRFYAVLARAALRSGNIALMRQALPLSGADPDRIPWIPEVGSPTSSTHPVQEEAVSALTRKFVDASDNFLELGMQLDMSSIAFTLTLESWVEYGHKTIPAHILDRACYLSLLRTGQYQAAAKRTSRVLLITSEFTTADNYRPLVDWWLGKEVDVDDPNLQAVAREIAELDARLARDLMEHTGHIEAAFEAGWRAVNYYLLAGDEKAAEKERKFTMKLADVLFGTSHGDAMGQLSLEQVADAEGAVSEVPADRAISLSHSL